MPVAATQLQNLIKITKVRKERNYEPWWRFKASLVSALSSNQRRRVIWLTEASQCFQIARVANIPTSFSFYSYVTVGGNPTFQVHSTEHAFRAGVPNLPLTMYPFRLGTTGLEHRWIVTVCCNYKRSDVKAIIWFLVVWQTSCWNGFVVVLKIIMMIFICGMFK